jgi:hypothetical protein
MMVLFLETRGGPLFRWKELQAGEGGGVDSQLTTGPEYNHLWFHMRFPGWQQWNLSD